MEDVYYLGIDWGKSLCGFAIADGETRIASAYCEVETAKVFEKIEKLREEIPFEKIIIGKTGTQGEQFTANEKVIDDFVEQLRERKFEVEFEEEFFSTKVAQFNLAEFRNKGISKNDNAESARIVLQGWLDRKL
jgi:RNase H-fold protein (predicted Holliday junction resolvase)